ncbi:MAG: DNA repair protein RecO [Candidatus Eisenbacteria bacterium]|nr:DNA repair protein RecO [Candidatus Eisenbacteria bacterium]
MALVQSEGIVLKTYALGDTSRIVVVYTRDLGMVKMVAKGARKLPSRFGATLEPLSRSRFHFYHRSDRELHLLSKTDPLAAAGLKLADLARLAHAQAALELLDRLLWGDEPHPELYDLLAASLEATIAAPIAQLPAITGAFQLQVAGLLGYRPRLDACANCGGALSPERLFSAARGGLMCASCATSEPGVTRLSADALAGLSLLLSKPVAEAGKYVELRRAGEILRVVEQFLRHHFQRFQGLRSLEVLRSLDEAGTSARPAPGAAAAPKPGEADPIARDALGASDGGPGSRLKPGNEPGSRRKPRGFRDAAHLR